MTSYSLLFYFVSRWICYYYNILLLHFRTFSEPVDNQIVTVYRIVIVKRRTIMVGCSKNNVNFPDFNDKLLVHFCTLLASEYTIAPLSYFL